MSQKGLETQKNYPLNKKIKEIFWGAWCMQTNWNYERQMNTRKKHIADTWNSSISLHSVVH